MKREFTSYHARVGYAKVVCPKCNRRAFYIDVDRWKRPGFSQCSACGFSPELLAAGYHDPQMTATGLRPSRMSAEWFAEQLEEQL